MDASKALFRSKLRESAQKKEKRIDSELVRYNEYDQPVCRVCNVTLKSDANWPAHQHSRKHHEAIENLRVAAAKLKRPETSLEEPSEPPKARSSSILPSDFFDNQNLKRQKTDVPHNGKNVDGSGKTHQQDPKELGLMKSQSEESASVTVKKTKVSVPENFIDNDKSRDRQSSSHLIPAGKEQGSSVAKSVKGALPDGFFDSKERSEIDDARQLNEPRMDSLQPKQPTGALPEGFFDNKEADLRARGIEPAKVDIDDEYKEFEKVVQVDVEEVDDRLAEEEIHAAEIREQYEALEQRGLLEQVEMFKQRSLEKKTAQLARGQRRPAFEKQESSDESSSDTDGEEENFVVDWRAKHL